MTYLGNTKTKYVWLTCNLLHNGLEQQLYRYLSDMSCTSTPHIMQPYRQPNYSLMLRNILLLN